MSPSKCDLATCFAILLNLAAGLSQLPTKQIPVSPQQVFNAQVSPLGESAATQSSSLSQGVSPSHGAFWPQNPTLSEFVKQKQSVLSGLQVGTKPVEQVWPVQVGVAVTVAVTVVG